MKSIKKGEEIRRVNDSDAKIFIEKRGWNYCPKSEWKKYIKKNKLNI